MLYFALLSVSACLQLGMVSCVHGCSRILFDNPDVQVPVGETLRLEQTREVSADGLVDHVVGGEIRLRSKVSGSWI